MPWHLDCFMYLRNTLESEMSTKLKQNTKNENNFDPFFYVDFSKASLEAIDAILSALNAEVDSAIAMNRCPTLEGAFGKLSPTSSMMM